MRKTPNFLIALIALVLLAPMVSNTSAQTRRDDDVAVIVNPLNNIESLSSADLRKIFMGEKRSWSGSLPVFLVVRAPEAKEREILLERVLKMNESEYKNYWVKMVYSEQVSREPLAVFSNNMQQEAIRAEKGGIALVLMKDVHPGVKVIKIDGFTPGAAAYPLR